MRSLLLAWLVVATIAAFPSFASAQSGTTPEIINQTGHLADVTSVAFSPDGKSLVSASADRTIKFWDVTTGRELATLFGHGQPVLTVDFSENGQYLLSASVDSVQLWDVRTLKPLKNFTDGRAPAAFLPGTNNIAMWRAEFRSSSPGEYVEKAAIVFKTPAGEDIFSPVDTNRDTVSAFSWVLDHPALNRFSSFLSTRAVGPVMSWGQAGREKTFRLFWRSDSVSVSSRGETTRSGKPLASTPDASVLTVIRNGINVFDTSRQGHHKVRVERQFSDPVSVALAPGGKLVLTGYANGQAAVHSLDGEHQKTLSGHDTPVSVVAFSPDAKLAVTASAETLKLWSIVSGETVHTLGGRGAEVTALAFSNRSRLMIHGSRGGAISLWDLATGRQIKRFNGHSGPISGLFMTQDDRFVISAGGQEVSMWDAADGRLVSKLSKPDPNVEKDILASQPWATPGTPLAYVPATELVVGSIGQPGITPNHQVAVWDIATRSNRAATPMPYFQPGIHGTNWLSAVAVSPDGALIVAGSLGQKRYNNTIVGGQPGSDATLFTWDIATNKRQSIAGAGPVRAVAFVPDGRTFATGGEGPGIKVWNTATGSLVRSFTGSSSAINSIDISSDGRFLAAAGADHTVSIWNYASGDLVKRLTGHTQRVLTLRFSPDSALIGSGAADGSVRIWQTATGAELLRRFSANDGSWCAITPSGFFHCNDTANLPIHVRHGSGVTLIDQMYFSLFNPDLVRESLAGDPVGEVAKAASLINLSKVLESGPAPQVEITTDLTAVSQQSDTVSIAARITDRGKGVGRIEWRVNGVTAAVSTRPKVGGADFTITQELALDTGDNNIELVAYNATNLLASLPARIAVKSAIKSDATKPTLHVLAIGINAYKDTGWKLPGVAEPELFAPLSLAVADGKALTAALTKAARRNYAAVRVTEAYDADATAANLDLLVTKLAKDVHPRDTFVLFAAAHGFSHAGRFYLIPQDFEGGPDPQALLQRAIGQDKLQDWLANRVKARRSVLLLDTCESGALVAGGRRDRISEPASEAAIGRLHEATGRPVLTAAAEGKPAFEGYEGHGVFTWALLDALKASDRNNNGLIELTELAGHVQDKVPEVAAKLQGRGRAAITARGASSDRQSAQFGSRGEDFPIVGRLP